MRGKPSPLLMLALTAVVATAAAWGWSRLRGNGVLTAAEPEFALLLRDGRAGEGRWVEGRGGRLEFPAGQYRLAGWRVRMPDERGRAWEIRSIPGEPMRSVRVRPRRETRLPLATPLEPQLVVEESGRDAVFRLRFRGAGGETCGELLVDGEVAPPPTLRIEDARGRVVERLRFDNTCGAGCAQLWRPPANLAQPLRAVPEMDLGPFRVAEAAFRFRLPARSSP